MALTGDEQPDRFGVRALRGYIPYIVGMAFWWPMLRPPYLGPLFAAAGDYMNVARLAFDLTFVLLGLAGIAFVRTVGKGSGRKNARAQTCA